VKEAKKKTDREVAAKSTNCTKDRNERWKRLIRGFRGRNIQRQTALSYRKAPLDL